MEKDELDIYPTVYPLKLMNGTNPMGDAESQTKGDIVSAPRLNVYSVLSVGQLREMLAEARAESRRLYEGKVVAKSCTVFYAKAIAEAESDGTRQIPSYEWTTTIPKQTESA